MVRVFTAADWPSPMDRLHQIFPLVAGASMILFGSSCCSLLNVSTCSTFKVTPLMLSVCHEDLVRGIVGWTEVGTLLFLRASRERIWERFIWSTGRKGAGGDMEDRHEPSHPSAWARPLRRWSLHTIGVPFGCCLTCSGHWRSIWAPRMQGGLVRCPFPNGGCMKESEELDVSLCLLVWWLQV